MVITGVNMQINKQIFYSQVFNQIREEFYKDCIFSDSLGKHIKVEELEFEDYTDEDHGRPFWGFILKKDKKSYLISDKTDMDDIFPMRLKTDRPETLVKVAFKGEVFWLIRGYTSIKIKPEKIYDLKTMLDMLSSFDHKCPEHYRLLWLQELTQLLTSANYRNATPPGFGKDSIGECANILHGNVSILDDEPTKAKLEERTAVCKHLIISEPMDQPLPIWKQLEQFILKAGAKKANITKRSRAYGGVKEDINASKLSLSLIYNDINSYPDMTKYLDFISKEAVLDRLVPFRLAGRLTEPFSQLKTEDIPKLVEQGLPIYRALIKSLLYYKTNYGAYIQSFDRSKLVKMPERWHGNVMQLLDTCSIVSKDQEEFDKHVELVNFCHKEYFTMLEFPTHWEKFKRKVPPKELSNESKKISEILYFKDKIQYINDYLNTEKPVSEQEWSL